ncbi:Abi family protein [Geomicrobium sp. JCM 19038]|uniref:Abi family protein n=1 Tax=Geomicrobium sp. JCM 19038 TaxID=1460635 RepID=UPI001930BB89|nr:Abi family protein [Geomicrobium sp. JCM 19038]
MKPFKTPRQQLVILRDRGLEINNGSKAMRALERETYYGLINGYKGLFLKRINGKLKDPEEYITGTQFEEIYNLYSFDRELRHLFIEYILLFESNIKSKISYRFTEQYKEPHAYLVMKNYSSDPKLLKDVLGTIATISNTISSRSKQGGRSPIKHYLDKHKSVPLWVLIHYMTLGNVNFFL